MEYKPGRTYKVADALNRKAELAALTADKQRSVSQLTSTLHQRIRKGLESDPQALIDLVKKGNTQRFWLDDGLLLQGAACMYRRLMG